jgi:hypothetical protein
MVLLPCVCVGAVFFAAFGLHSYHPTDHGFVLGLGWRIHGGQVPYRDFLYIRPPGTIYLHSIWFALPEAWALPAARAAFYAQMTLSAVLPALAALRAGLVRSPATLGALSAGFLAAALHNFPAMPWYTVDGVFFASIGLAAWTVSLREPDSGRAIGWRVLASLGFALAPLCKQNFVFPALFFGGVCTWELFHTARRGAREPRALFLASSLPALGVASILLGSLGAAELLPAFVDQITTGSGLLGAGFWNYVLYWPWWAVLPGLAWPWLTRRLSDDAVPAALPAACVALSPLGMLALVLLADTSADLGRLLLWFLLGSLATRSFLLLRARGAHGKSDRSSDREADRDPNGGLRLLLATGIFVIGWSASLSWGYPKPNLGLAAMAVAIMDLLPRVDRRGLAPLAATASAAIFVAYAFELNRAEPYRDVRISRQVASLHETYPRFGHLSSNPGLAAQYRELKELIQRHALDAGRDFTVLHDFPLIHYLVDRQSPARLDWYFHSEMQGRADALLTQLLELDAVFFLYKRRTVSPIGYNRGFDRACDAETMQHSPMLSRPILKAGTLLEEARFFCVVSLGEGRASPTAPR